MPGRPVPGRLARGRPAAATPAAPGPPAWASALGVVAVVLGVFLCAFHGNEAMKQMVLDRNMPASGAMPAADCPEDELEEEGLSLAECEYMVEHVKGLVLSMPEWFSGYYTWAAVAGTVLAFLSILVGGALVNYTPAAAIAGLLVFPGLAAVDAAQFTMVVNAGPIIRDQYLWNILLWFIIHVLMTLGVVAGRRSAAA